MAARPTNRMQEATDLLMSRFVSHASVLIDYRNGPRICRGVYATIGRTPFELEEGGVLMPYESRDYILAAAELVDEDTEQALLPESGATITEQVSGKVFSVAAPKGFNVYESIGPDGTVLKVHTKG